jgi:hypothetical protein
MGKRQDLSQLPGDVRNRGNKNPTCGGRFTTLDFSLSLVLALWTRVSIAAGNSHPLI